MLGNGRTAQYSHPLEKSRIQRDIHHSPDLDDSRSVPYASGPLSAYRGGRATIEELAHMNAARLYECDFSMARFDEVRVPF